MSFLIGANLPWLRYGCDFGANAWHPQGGVADPPMTSELRRHFDTLVAAHIRTVRWFLFCDGRAGIRFDAHGDAIGLDNRVLRDLDAALSVASDAGVRLMLTLFDYHWCRPRTRVGGVDLGGRRRLLVDQGARAALLERVVAPVFDRASGHPAVWAWDVMNEPEWITLGRGTFHPAVGIRPSRVRALLSDVVRLARTRTSQPVTVGLASSRGLGLVRHLGLDFYQVHWYDSVDRRAPLAKPVARWNLDRPVLLGEFPTRGSRRTPGDILAAAREHGYCGAFCWSVNAADTASDFAGAASVLRQFEGVKQ